MGKRSNMGFRAVFISYSTGMAPVVSYHYDALAKIFVSYNAEFLEMIV